MPVRTYDPKQVILAIGGVPMSGYADGTFIRVSRSTDSFSKVSGADGVVSRSKSNDFSGEVVVTLAQTSPSNDVLSAFLAADELTNKGVLPILCKDMSGRSIHFTGFAWIRKPADAEYGKDIANREWTLDCADLVMGTAGNADFAPAV